MAQSTTVDGADKAVKSFAALRAHMYSAINAFGRISPMHMCARSRRMMTGRALCATKTS